MDMTTANRILNILFADFQYSDQEKETMANLYRNADMTDDVKNYIQDEIAKHTSGMTLDGHIIDCFSAAIQLTETDTHYIIDDGVVDAEEAEQIIELAGIGNGMSKNTVRTIEYCMQTFNVTEDAEAIIDNVLASDAEERSKKVEEKTKAITEAAQKMKP